MTRDEGLLFAAAVQKFGEALALMGACLRAWPAEAAEPLPPVSGRCPHPPARVVKIGTMGHPDTQFCMECYTEFSVQRATTTTQEDTTP